MPTREHRVVIAEPFARSGYDIFTQRGIDVVSCVGRPYGELIEALREADGLIVRSETRVDRDLLANAPRMRVVGRAGVGVDAIDLAAASEAGILIVNTPAANTIAATEHTFALMLASIRRIAQANALVRSGRWERGTLVGNELFGKTLGIVGLGRIGAAVAARAKAFAMEVVAHDPYVPQARAHALQIELTSFERLLEAADVVTLHVPLTAHTRAMIDARALARMKRGALLVNCSRGRVVDEQALIAALDAQTLCGAAIDVVAHEPPLPESPGAALLRHPLVLATPHIGGSTHEALERIAVELATDVAEALLGRPAAGAVNAPAPSGADAPRLRRFVDAADRLGRLVPQLFTESLNLPMQLVCTGDLAPADPEPLRAAFLAGLLQTTTERRITIVNARAVASEIGIALEVVSDSQPSAYAATIGIRAGDRVITASVLSGGPRIVQIDAYELDAIPQGTWIVTHHRDVPGMVGRIGTILGHSGINISTMQVARDVSQAAALMVMAVDRLPAESDLQAMRAIEGMCRVDAAVL